MNRPSFVGVSDIHTEVRPVVLAGLGALATLLWRRCARPDPASMGARGPAADSGPLDIPLVGRVGGAPSLRLDEEALALPAPAAQTPMTLLTAGESL